MRVVPHPLLERDIIGMAEYVYAVSGDADAARRRIIEARDLIGSITTNPNIGVALDGDLDGWRVHHGGGGRRITVVFLYKSVHEELYVALVAFGGQDWQGRAIGRSAFDIEDVD